MPTYPVFGPRSEEPDGIEPELQLMSPDGSPSMEGEPLPPPRDDSALDNDMNDDLSADEDADEFEDESREPTLAAPRQLVQPAGWRPAKQRRTESETPTRPCATCSPSFRRPPSSAR